MQAVVLAGGQGSRLRPLTVNVPKPVVPLAGRPFLSFMLDWLAGHGVDDVVLSCGFLSREVERVLGPRHGSMRLRYVEEDSPLGTAGPVRLAHDRGLLDERFLVLNGDVLTDLDLSLQLDLHGRRGAAATLALVEVDDTSSYGVVPTAGDGAVEAFLEKSDGPAPTNRINAGAYVLERSVVERIEPGRAVSFEREVFPGLVGEGLYGYDAEGYWIDIGTRERYLEATYDLLSGRVASLLPRRDDTGSLVPECCTTRGARIGPLSVLGRRCRVGSEALIERSVLHDGVQVGDGSVVKQSVLAAGVTVGRGARVGEGAMIGSGAWIRPGRTVEAMAQVAPGALV
jgi:mannose-1-phosphate guanylyltransferase